MPSVLPSALLCLVFCRHALSAGLAPRVVTSRGPVEGVYRGNRVAAFFGVPYAQAPVGALRFQRTRSLPSWNGTLVAAESPPICMQNLEQRPAEELVGLRMSENCLFLNIFTPEPSHFPKLPVMVFIHGGGYREGDAGMLHPDGIVANLVPNEVVVVTMQYRLGVFGFFTSLDPNIPPNNGMFDQLEALRWVQAEIAGFGGDPNKVTLVGHSAGAFSASLHTLSPLSSGLAAQAVLMSGTAYCPNALDGNDNVHRTHARSSKDFALATGCVGEAEWSLRTTGPLRRCLQLMSAADVLEAADEATKNTPCCPWSPLVDGPGGFLPDYPYRLRRPKHFPLLLGTASHEMLRFFAKGIEEGSTPLPLFNRLTFNSALNELAAPEAEFGQMTEAVRHLLSFVYAKPNGTSIGPFDFAHWYQAMEEMLSGKAFLYGTARMAGEWWETSPAQTYLYEFDYASDNFPWPSSMGHVFKGAFHGLELDYLAPGQKALQWFAAKDFELSRLMATMWTNFAKTGSPNRPNPLGVRWEPLEKASPKVFLRIGDPPEMVTTRTYAGVAENLWNGIVPSTVGRWVGPTFAPRGPANASAASAAAFGTQAQPACPVRLRNSGYYILRADFVTQDGPRSATILTEKTISGRGVVFLRAVGGAESVCRLPEAGSQACAGHATIECRGTALTFNCRYLDFPEGLCA